jgi:hypothetical protein
MGKLMIVDMARGTFTMFVFTFLDIYVGGDWRGL